MQAHNGKLLPGSLDQPSFSEKVLHLVLSEAAVRDSVGCFGCTRVQQVGERLCLDHVGDDEPTGSRFEEGRKDFGGVLGRAGMSYFGE